MNGNTKIPLGQLMISIFLCMTSILIMQNFYQKSSMSFGFCVICILISFVVVFAFFMPSLLLKQKSIRAVTLVKHSVNPFLSMLSATIYGMYFVYASVYFLLYYTEMIEQKLNPNADFSILVFLFLLCCVYAAIKGENTVTRCSVLIFAFSFLTLLLIFFGNISNLDFSSYSISNKLNFNNMLENGSFYLTLSVTSVIFLCSSEKVKKLRKKYILVLTAFSAVLALIISFFCNFVLGTYGQQQSFSFFTLSKTAQIGVVNGFDALLLAMLTSTAFVLISLLLISTRKTAGQDSKNSIYVFAVVVLVLFICAQTSQFLKNIILNTYVLNAFTFITAVIIPLCRLKICKWGSKNEK